MPDLEVEPGVPVIVEDQAASDFDVILALGPACALAQDMDKWDKMDDERLVVLAMQSAIAMVQKSQVILKRLEGSHTRVPELKEENKRLQATLRAKEEELKDEVERNVGLVTELETMMADIAMQRAVVETQEKLAADLLEDLNSRGKSPRPPWQSRKPNMSRIWKSRGPSSEKGSKPRSMPFATKGTKGYGG